jgi:hypothetical protein
MAIAEVVLAIVTYRMCWITKWPLKGPITIFIGYPGWALIYGLASALLWLVVGLIFAVVRWNSKSKDLIWIGLPK